MSVSGANAGSAELLPAGRGGASSYLYPLAATAVLFAVWELAARFGNISPLLQIGRAHV